MATADLEKMLRPSPLQRAADWCAHYWPLLLLTMFALGWQAALWFIDITRETFVVPCQEDEAAVVLHDPDPSHGLRWGCVNAQEWRDAGTQVPAGDQVVILP